MDRKGARKGKASTPEAAPDTRAVKGAASRPAASEEEVRRVMPVPSRPAPPVNAASPPPPGKDDWRRHLAAPREEPRPGVPARVAGPRAPLGTPIRAAEAGEPEHRHFPRSTFTTRFELWMDEAEGGQRRFAASLPSINVSVSGAFLESTFFLPVGTELNVRFALEEGTEPVRARAQIVREERGEGPEGHTGFGVRFVEFSGQTEVALSRLFLGNKLRAFAEEYLQSRRARSLPNELERVVDVLAAWELLKATTPGDPWRGE